MELRSLIKAVRCNDAGAKEALIAIVEKQERQLAQLANVKEPAPIAPKKKK